MAPLLVVLVTAQVLLFVRPVGDQPRPADAVVVLGGPGERIDAGIDLVRRGFADTLVIASQSPENCGPEVDVEQICFTPDPGTTRGEAQEIGRLVRERGWTQVLVVAQNEQVVRARLRIGRCVGPDVGVTVVAVRGNLGESLARTLYETGALPKALVVQRGC